MALIDNRRTAMANEETLSDKIIKILKDIGLTELITGFIGLWFGRSAADKEAAETPGQKVWSALFAYFSSKDEVAFLNIQRKADRVTFRYIFVYLWFLQRADLLAGRVQGKRLRNILCTNILNSEQPVQLLVRAASVMRAALKQGEVSEAAAWEAAKHGNFVHFEKAFQVLTEWFKNAGYLPQTSAADADAMQKRVTDAIKSVGEKTGHMIGQATSQASATGRTTQSALEDWARQRAERLRRERIDWENRKGENKE